MSQYASPRTVAGVEYTLAAAKRQGWRDYGTQAQADVAFLLAEIARLRREREEAEGK